MEKIQCAVLGATGTVGQRFIQLLEDHPYFEPVALAASRRREGEPYGSSVKWLLEGDIPHDATSMKLIPLDPVFIEDSGARVVFSALPADVAHDLELELARRGMWVFSNAASHRMDDHVPILIPEVNAHHLDIISAQDTPGKIVTNANCSTTGLALGLAPLLPFGIRQVVVSTYQALSGAGYPGVPSTDILGNVIPYIGGEERKMVEETRRILGEVEDGRIIDHPVRVVASCARVPVENGHLESVAVELEHRVAQATLIGALNDFRGPDEMVELPTAPQRPLIVNSGPDRPQPRLDVMAGGPGRSSGMSVVIGRFHTIGNWVRFFLLSHNTIRGAAGGSILNAELSQSRGLLEGPR